MTDENQNMPENESLEIDFSVCCPNADAPAEPYHAIMKIDENGNADGTIWGQGTKLMLFSDQNAAKQILGVLNAPDYALRGVTKAHLDVLKQIEASGRAELFVIIGFTMNGQIEAMPLAEHLARVSKAGSPPPIKKRG